MNISVYNEYVEDIGVARRIIPRSLMLTNLYPKFFEKYFDCETVQLI